VVHLDVRRDQAGGGSQRLAGAGVAGVTRERTAADLHPEPVPGLEPVQAPSPPGVSIEALVQPDDPDDRAVGLGMGPAGRFAASEGRT
jgi:hypothetical protein